MTKKQRNKVYKKAYESVGNGNSRYICLTLHYYTNHRLSNTTLLNVFEEFKLFKPKNRSIDNSWFGYDMESQQERLNALAFCIAMTE